MRQATLSSSKMTYDPNKAEFTDIYTGFIEDKDIENLTYSFSNKFDVIDNPLEYGLKHTDLPGPFINGLTNKIGTLFEIAGATNKIVEQATSIVPTNVHKYYATSQNGGINSFVMKNGNGFTINKLFTIPSDGSSASGGSSKDLASTIETFSLLATGGGESNGSTFTANNPGPTPLQWSNAMVLGAKNIVSNLGSFKNNVSKAFSPPLEPLSFGMGAVGAAFGAALFALRPKLFSKKDYAKYYDETGSGYKALQNLYKDLYTIESKLADAVLDAFPGVMYKLKIDGFDTIGPFIIESVSMDIDFSNIDSNGIPLKSGIAIKNYKLLNLKNLP